jgi:hypothetical protein
MLLARRRYRSEIWWMRSRLVLVVVVSTALADVAHAQDGVFIDPGSPTGKEYEIPFEAARRGAEPGSDPSAPIPQGERSAPPFGEGITGDSAADSSNADGSTGGQSASGQQNGAASGNASRRGGDASTSGGATSQIVDAAANNPGAPPSSTGSTLLYLGGGALVLALGAGIGVLLRRRRA